MPGVFIGTWRNVFTDEGMVPISYNKDQVWNLNPCLYFLKSFLLIRGDRAWFLREWSLPTVSCQSWGRIAFAWGEKNHGFSRIMKLRIKPKVAAVSFQDLIGGERSWENFPIGSMFPHIRKQCLTKCGLEINASGHGKVKISVTKPNSSYPDTSEFVN